MHFTTCDSNLEFDLQLQNDNKLTLYGHYKPCQKLMINFFIQTMWLHSDLEVYEQFLPLLLALTYLTEKN